jgi:hypothetical protein
LGQVDHGPSLPTTDLIVGDTATGTLTVESGGTVTNTEVSNSLIVGSMAPGTLIIGPDDIAALRRKYKKANGGGHLWDEQKRPVQPALEPQAATTLRKDPGVSVKEHIGRLLGSRAASTVRERQNERTSRRQEVSKRRTDPRDKIRAAMGAL